MHEDDVREVEIHRSDYDDMDEYERHRRATTVATESRSPSRHRTETHERHDADLISLVTPRRPSPGQPSMETRPVMVQGQRFGTSAAYRAAHAVDAITDITNQIKPNKPAYFVPRRARKWAQVSYVMLERPDEVGAEGVLDLRRDPCEVCQ